MAGGAHAHSLLEGGGIPRTAGFGGQAGCFLRTVSALTRKHLKIKPKDQAGLAGKAFSGSPAMGAHPHQERPCSEGSPRGVTPWARMGLQGSPPESPHPSGAQGDPQSEERTDSHGDTGVSHQIHTCLWHTGVSMRNRDSP